VHDFVAHQQSSLKKKSSLQDREVIFRGISQKIIHLLYRMLHNEFFQITSKPPFIPLLLILKILRMSWETYVLQLLCLYHDTVMVYTFQKHLIPLFKENVPDISKIYYFSYGASAQYKNKNNFINLCHHNADFGINAAWHFFATSRGRGPCGGVGGTFKHFAAHSSLQHHQVLTPAQLYSRAKEHLPSIHVQYVCNNEVEQIRHRLKLRFDNTRIAVGTHQYPYFEHTLVAKKYSTVKKAL
jgi:hypothetical protein